MIFELLFNTEHIHIYDTDKYNTAIQIQNTESVGF